VIAKGALLDEVCGVGIALDDDFGFGGHFEGDGEAGSEFDGLVAQEAGEEDFVHTGRQRRGGGIGEGGVAAEDECDGHFLAGGGPCSGMGGAVVVYLPVHGAGACRELLDAVHADVAFVCLGVFGVDAGQG